MSYARFTNGDVYVFDNGQHIVCCGCKLAHEDFLASRLVMLRHLQEHVAAGHEVPESAMERLTWELNNQQTVFGALRHEEESDET